MIKVYLSAFKAQNSKSPSLRAYLVHNFKHMFLVFKQHYTHFHTLCHPHIFLKKLKIVV